MSPFSGGLATVAEVATATEASGVFALTWLLVALPLLGAAVLLLGGRRTDRWGHWLGVLMSGGSFVVAVAHLLRHARPERRGPHGHPAPLRLDRTSARFHVPFDLQLDQLSIASCC